MGSLVLISDDPTAPVPAGALRSSTVNNSTFFALLTTNKIVFKTNLCNVSQFFLKSTCKYGKFPMRHIDKVTDYCWTISTYH